MSTIQDKFKEITTSEKFIQKYGFELASSEELVAVFESGYKLAQKELEEQVSYLKSQVELGASYCEVYTEDIKKLNTIVKEARKVIEELLSDVRGEGIDHYDGGVLAKAYLEEWK